MGAIFGHICLEPGGRTDRGRLEVVASALAGCGPHGGGRWADGPAALGAAILHDTPEALQECQPIRSREGRWALVADARLDNRDELLGLLEPGEAAEPSAIPDSALLLAAWERWGEACPDRLLGDFAFAVWDARERSLFLARDPMGVKPLYYHHAPRGLGFLFASQLAGLLALDEVPRRLDRRTAAAQLLVLNDDKEHTLFADVRRLPPGHRLVVGHGRPPRLDRYWRPAPARGLRMASLDDWAEALGAEIVRAVAASTRSAGGVAAHLSGGLDSSAVTCLAARELERGGRRLRALSFSVPPEGDDVVTGAVVDAPFIEAVRDFARVEVHYKGFEAVSFDELLAETAPGMTPPEYRTTPLHRWAQSEGLRVLLSGWGGDEAASFNSRGHPAALALSGRWRELARLMRDLQRRRRIRSRRQFLMRRVVAPLAPAALLPRIDGSRGALADLLSVSPISDELAREAGVRGRVGDGRLERAGSRRMRRGLLENGHLVARIEAWSADASRFGIDYRYPLLDRRVLELALALPGRAFLQDGLTRWVFRKALVGRMPEVVLWRPGKLDSVVQRNQAQRLEAAQRRERAEDSSPADDGPPEWVRKLLAEGDDLGGCVSLDKLRRFVAEMPPGGYSPAADISERVPALAVGLLGTLVKLVEHNKITCG